MGNTPSNGYDDCYCRRCQTRGPIESNGKCSSCQGKSTTKDSNLQYLGYCRRCSNYCSLESNGKCSSCKGLST